jgi:DNA replication protein DnaC
MNTPSLFQKSELECEICEDSGSVFGTFLDPFSKEELECMKPCTCLEPKRAEFILNQMPELYRTADLDSIEPWEHKFRKQDEILAEVKKERFESYLFVGNSGVGKSYIAWALWKNAALSGRMAIATTAAELMQEYRDFDTASDEETKRPKVLPTDLAQNRIKYSIFIDEIEKIRVSVYAVEKLFELVKNAVDNGHQLIVTSNMRTGELKRVFSQIDEIWGSAIMRRLLENTVVLEMWK